MIFNFLKLGGGGLPPVPDITTFTFQLEGDHYILTGFDFRGLDPGTTAITLPTEYNGLPVTKVYSFSFGTHELGPVKEITFLYEAGWRFEGYINSNWRLPLIKNGLEKVTFAYLPPETMYWGSASFIGDRSGFAFNCSTLKTIEAQNASQIYTIGNTAFEGCTSLESIPFNNFNTLYGSVFKDSGITRGDFTGVTLLGGTNFYNCRNIKNLILSYNGTLQGDNIYNMVNLETVKISNVSVINGGNFRNCPKLKTVILDVDSISFGSLSSTFGGVPALTSILTRANFVEELKNIFTSNGRSDLALLVGVYNG